MTNTEKAEMLNSLLFPDSFEIENLIPCIKAAESIVLNRRYPFGYDAETVVPPKYEMIQIQIALDLFNKKGAEGQTTHTENGITRQWNTDLVSSSLLKLIVPVCEGVVSNANNA